MLEWWPDRRVSAAECLQHSWLSKVPPYLNVENSQKIQGTLETHENKNNNGNSTENSVLIPLRSVATLDENIESMSLRNSENNNININNVVMNPVEGNRNILEKIPSDKNMESEGKNRNEMETELSENIPTPEKAENK